MFYVTLRLYQQPLLRISTRHRWEVEEPQLAQVQIPAKLKCRFQCFVGVNLKPNEELMIQI